MFADRTNNRSSACLFQALENRQLMSVNLPYGAIVPGQISAPATEMDVYTFTAKQGSTVELNSFETDIDRAFTATFVLKDPNGGLVKKWYASQSLRVENLSAGPYTIEVTDRYQRSRGDYKIGLEGISPISPDAQPLKRGGVVTGELTDTIDAKEYKFSVINGATIQVSTMAGDIDTAFTARFDLYNASGAVVKTWYNWGEQRIENLPGGQYMIKVKDRYQGHRGTFGIGLEFLSRPFSPDAKPLANNVLNSGTLANGIDVNQFTFVANSSSVNFTTGVTKIDTAFTGKFVLYDVNGTPLTTWYNNANGSVTGLTPGATYMLKVQDRYQGHRGSYSLKAIGVTPISFAPRIASVIATPASAVSGAAIGLVANVVSDLANDTNAVRFYRESNGIAGLQTGPGGDILLATDTKAADGYKATFSSTGLKGSVTLYAQASDANDALSAVVSTKVFLS